ncbi:MAG: hypothetical protein V3T31_06100 [candidate division Zixibacteria bacterium]
MRIQNLIIAFLLLSVAAAASLYAKDDLIESEHLDLMFHDIASDAELLAQIDDLSEHDQALWFERRQGSNRPLRQGGNRGGGNMDGRRKRHIEQLRILKLLEMLDLDEGQEIEFLTRFRTHRKNDRTIAEEHRTRLADLGKLLHSSNASDQQLSEAIEAARQVRLKKQQAHDTFLEKVRPLLTTNQFGRLIIFQDRFEFELLQEVRQFRKDRQSVHKEERP